MNTESALVRAPPAYLIIDLKVLLRQRIIPPKTKTLKPYIPAQPEIMRNFYSPVTADNLPLE